MVGKVINAGDHRLFAPHLPGFPLPPLGEIAAESAELQHIPVLFVELDLPGDLPPLLGGQFAEIQFIAQYAKGRHIEPGGQRHIAQCLGIGAHGHMIGNAGRRIEAVHTTLDLQPFRRVRIVRCPDLRRKAQHTQIKPIAAGGTTFQQYIGVLLREDPPQHIVKAQDIAVEKFALICQFRRKRIGDVTVIIPLDIFDVGAAQDLVHRLHDVIPDLCSGQVQHHLVAAQAWFPAGDMNSPIRVGPIEFTVGINALRLKPKAELKTHSVDIFAEPADAAGQFLFVHHPIAKTRFIVIALTEPAVIQHEHFDTQTGSLAGHGEDLLAVKVEHGGFPVVQHHRPFHTPERLGNDMIIDKIVEIGSHAVDAVFREGHYRLGSNKLFTGLQLPVEAMGADAPANTHLVETIQFHGGIMVAAIKEIEAKHIALPLVGAGAQQCKRRVVPVGGSAHGGILHMDAMGYRHSVDMGLFCPTAVQGQQRMILKGNVHHGA